MSPTHSDVTTGDPNPAPLERCTQAHREDPGIRAVHDRLGDKWSLLVIVELTHGPLRFRQLQRAVGGISQRMLTLTVRRLERDGLVEYVQRRGVIVRAFTIADVEEIYTIRNALEMLTLPAIIQKATADDIAALRDRLHEMDGVMASRDFETLSPMARAFHRQMTEICGQNRILRVIEGQDQYITRFSSMAISQENRLLQAHEEHYKLVDYVEQRDLEHFQKLMHRHIERSKEKCLEALKTQRYLQKM